MFYVNVPDTWCVGCYLEVFDESEHTPLCWLVLRSCLQGESRPAILVHLDHSGNRQEVLLVLAGDLPLSGLLGYGRRLHCRTNRLLDLHSKDREGFQQSRSKAKGGEGGVIPSPSLGIDGSQLHAGRRQPVFPAGAVFYLY